MKKIFITLNLFALLLVSVVARAQSTAFTYQGLLNDGGSAATGSYDLTFSLFYTNTAGMAVAGPVTNGATAVSNGLFSTAIDFGSGVFNGTNCWLEIGVRTNGSATAFGILTPRQPLTPVPYALFALTPAGTNGVNGTNGLNGATGPAGPLLPDVALVDTNQTFTGSNIFSGVLIATNAANTITGAFTGNGGGLTNLNVSGSQITGIIQLSQLPASVVTNGASGVTFSGTFSGNGAGVTNVNLSANSSGTIRGPGIFAPPMTLPVGTFPLWATAADVNGDGRMDLISANFGDNTLTVLTNNGIGGFGFYATLSVGSEAESVAAADVNGDGRVDLISANFGAGTLTVLTNNGIGGFGSNATLSVGSGPEAVVAADVNGDGKPDLISANEGASTLSVLTNNGNGAFGAYATLGVSSGPFSVIATDVNGDGRPDLICANNSLTVFTNNGHGGFGLNATLSVVGARQVVAADVNGDGKPDLISANSATLSVLTNNGIGGFHLNATLNIAGGPYSVVAADVNGDGKPDLICSKANSDVTAFMLMVFTNNGSGVFGSNATLTVSQTPYWVTAADLNGDGKPDLISANANDNSLTVFFDETIFTGAFVGDGSGLTSLNAASLTGTIADAALSANVALRAGGNTFNGTQIVTNGNVGIGTTTPDALLSVNGTADKPGGGSWSTYSDRRLKDVGTNFTHGLEALDVIQPVHYHYKSDNPLKLPSQPDFVGVVAQQVQGAIPEAVQRNQDGYLVVNNDPIIWTMFNAIKELNQKNQKNEAEVKAKDAKIQDLEARLEKLEQVINAKNGRTK